MSEAEGLQRKRANDAQDIDTNNDGAEMSTKRPRLDPTPAAATAATTTISERAVGIEEYVDAAARPAFHAIIKQRFTDFQVFEVDQAGTVQHISDLAPPKHDPPSDLEKRIQRDRDGHGRVIEAPKREVKEPVKRPTWDELDAELMKKLPSVFDDDGIAQLKDLWTTGWNPVAVPQGEATEPKADSRSRDSGRGGAGGRPQQQSSSKPRDPRTVVTKPLADKADRTAAHGLVRELFQGYLVSEAQNRHVTDASSSSDAKDSSAAPSIVVKWTPNGMPDTRGNPNPQSQAAKDTNPPYLHFLLQKTNRDSHEALGLLSRALRLAPGAGGGGGGGRGGRGGGRGGRGGRAEGGPSRDLSVAGTKDRRSVSVQRIALLRRGKTAEQIWALANGCETEFDSDLPGFAGGSGAGRGGGRGGRGGRARGGRGGRDANVNGFRQDGDARTYLDAFTKRGAKGLRVAHLEYADKPFHLGDLSGNEFLITLRNVKLLDHVEDAGLATNDGDGSVNKFEREEKIIDQAMTVLKERGFINYFGMQRFGTSDLSTHELGVPLFQADYKRAVELLLAPRATSTSARANSLSGIEADVARARDLFGEGQLQKAYDAMPRSYVTERTVLGRLIREEERQGWNKLPFDEEGIAERGLLKRDWLSAFGAIPRTLRMMYVHAYQSYIWNTMVSERVRRLGLDRPVVGDLVFLDPQDSADEGEMEMGEVDGEEGGAEREIDDDEVANAGEGSVGVDVPASTKPPKPRVKVLSEDDVGMYKITDVVMPLPGSEVTFAAGSWLDTLYRELLAKDGLKPEDLGSSNQPEYALRGAYRKLLHVPATLSYQLLRYTDPHIDLALSDEDRLLGFPEPSSDPQGSFLALQIRLQLGTSAYATMALREVLKTDTSSAAQKELTLKSEDQACIGVGSSVVGAAGAGAAGAEDV
ncbi:hypothetical protein A4X09_0g1631 [Tilletia walkeri]|uniref:TRUD domain-containing protein n=1 Tax=Tilletia walkeri TaxID=117179 RepID=A0A8X7T7B6_9BASI|nr:hypothetical protein A4X09_0g1631 [Tilletia walkeri]